MKNILLLLTLLPFLAVAKAPVEDDIADKTLDASSAYYYPGLMLRYNAGDPSLTDEDYHYLYYGYAYQDSYKPLNTNPDMDKMLQILARINPDMPLREDVEQLISVANDALARDPFSPKILNTLAFGYGALCDKAQETAYYRRMQQVLKTIEDSGDALSQKTPQHILMFEHALDLLTSKEVSYGKSSVISRTVEYIPLTIRIKTDEKKIKGYYFDFSRVYWNKPEGYTYKRDRTWQFNNLKPRTYK